MKNSKWGIIFLKKNFQSVRAMIESLFWRRRIINHTTRYIVKKIQTQVKKFPKRILIKKFQKKVTPFQVLFAASNIRIPMCERLSSVYFTNTLALLGLPVFLCSWFNRCQIRWITYVWTGHIYLRRRPDKYSSFTLLPGSLLLTPICSLFFLSVVWGVINNSIKL